MNDIGIKNLTGIIEPFTDNSIPICARCNCRLNSENRSQWSDIIKENKTQFICKDCETKNERICI